MTGVARIAGEVEALMALRTTGSLRKKQPHAAPGGRGERVLVSAVDQPVVGGVSRDQAALEYRQRFGHVADRYRMPLARKGLAEQRRIAVESRHDLRFMSFHTQLDRMRVEHRHQGLFLKCPDANAVPGVAGVVAGIGQGHGVAGVMLSRRSDRRRSAVAEGTALLMTIAARLRSVRGESSIVEEAPSQGELRHRLQVVRLR